MCKGDTNNTIYCGICNKDEPQHSAAESLDDKDRIFSNKYKSERISADLEDHKYMNLGKGLQLDEFGKEDLQIEMFPNWSNCFLCYSKKLSQTFHSIIKKVASTNLLNACQQQTLKCHNCSPVANAFANIQPFLKHCVSFSASYLLLLRYMYIIPHA